MNARTLGAIALMGGLAATGAGWAAPALPVFTPGDPINPLTGLRSRTRVPWHEGHDGIVKHCSGHHSPKEPRRLTRQRKRRQ